MILLDTNLLARLTNPADAQHSVARRAVGALRSGVNRPVLVPQTLYEFWAVATRGAGAAPVGQNGLGMVPNRASLWIRYFRRSFTILPDPPDLLDRWFSLVDQFGIAGTRSHDARLVAAMQTHGIADLLTFNAPDFRKLPVNIIDPASL
jgi:predicted nucleic acid-binding protein